MYIHTDFTSKLQSNSSLKFFKCNYDLKMLISEYYNTLIFPNSHIFALKIFILHLKMYMKCFNESKENHTHE